MIPNGFKILSESCTSNSCFYLNLALDLTLTVSTIQIEEIKHISVQIEKDYVMILSS